MSQSPGIHHRLDRTNSPMHVHEPAALDDKPNFFAHKGKSKSRSASMDNVQDHLKGVKSSNSLAAMDAEKKASAIAAADMQNVIQKLGGRVLPLVTSVSSRLWVKPGEDGVQSEEPIEWAIAMHGGAGEIKHVDTIDERLHEFKKILEEGKRLLQEGGHAVDVAEAVTCLLEDCPFFNAGKGSVFTNTGTQEMDAAIMDGATRNAGACANIGLIKNPVKLARTVMEKTSHILIVGPAAEQLGFSHGLMRADPHYFFVQERYDQLLEARAKGIVVLDHGGQLDAPKQNYASTSEPFKEVEKLCIEDSYVKTSDGIVGKPKKKEKGAGGIKLAKSPQLDAAKFIRTPSTSQEGRGGKDIPSKSMAQSNFSQEEVRSWALEEKYSTVGCVVKDKYGNVASAGSTGGLVNKQPGRMGDTAIIGAGVYASDMAAIACTGHGETFIRHSVAHQVESRMRYLDENIEEALASVMWQVLPPLSGGAIGVDSKGRLAASYNTFGMFTGLADATGHFECWDKADKVYKADDVLIPDEDPSPVNTPVGSP